MNESFVFYQSFYDAVKDLNDEQFGRIMRAIAEYGINENISENMDSLTKMVFTLVKPQLDANSKRRSDGQKGGRPSDKTTGSENEKPMVKNKKTTGSENEKPMVNESKNHGFVNEKPNVNVNDNVNANVNVNNNANVNDNVNGQEKDNANALSKKKTMPPTVEDVRAYCAERCNNVDAERFVDYYSANGWKVGKNPMKDWKAAVRTWEKNNRASPPADSFEQATQEFLARYANDTG